MNLQFKKILLGSMFSAKTTKTVIEKLTITARMRMLIKVVDTLNATVLKKNSDPTDRCPICRLKMGREPGHKINNAVTTIISTA